jgi:hypothetical protein
MATPNETFVLFERSQMVATPGGGHTGGEIIRIIRTYLTAKRAEQDLALLSEVVPGTEFAVRPIDHIDD